MNSSPDSPSAPGNPLPEVIKTEELTPSLLSPQDQTLYDAFSASFNAFSNRPCLGVRTKSEETGWGEYEWKSYGEVLEEAKAFAGGLIASGLRPEYDFLGIYSRNRPEWVIGSIAAVIQSLTVIPLYNASGPNSLKTIVGKTRVSTVMTMGEHLRILLDASVESGALKNVIIMDRIDLAHRALAQDYGVKILSFFEIVKKGQTLNTPPHPPKPSFLYSIMFTSGDPKGVMLTQSNILTALAGLRTIGILPSDVHLSYLPLAHVFEHLVVLNALLCGAAVGFWRGNITELYDDIAALRPTVMVGVPSVWNRLHDSVQFSLQKSNFVRRLMFSYGFSAKKIAKSDDETPFWNKYVFNKIAKTFGGRLRLLVSAAAPISPETMEFLKVCIAPVIQVFVVCTRFHCGKPIITTNVQICVGRPVPANETKLVDVPEMGYFANSTPPTGEVCVRGPSVFQGYFKDTEKTYASLQVFDSEGWFHTGDVARRNEDGTLTLIDRKKNLFKLSQGEYIAVEYLEGVYSRSKFVRQIFVYGDSLQPYIVAIVVPNEKYVWSWAEENKIKEKDFPEICRHPALKRKIFDDVAKTGLSQRLQWFELIKNIHVEPWPWTVDGGGLTPSGKLQRHILKKRYADVIDVLYQQPPMLIKPPKL